LLGKALFHPYDRWYALGYDQISLAHDEKTPLASYLVHWGLFLLLIISWMAEETISWMANTPLAALNKLKPYRSLILFGLAAYVLMIVGLTVDGVSISWFGVTLAFWCLILLLKPDMPDVKRFVLFMVGTAIVLTIAVDVIVIPGAGRMNTVFKFYLQAWILFAISAGASLAWVLPNALSVWRPRMSRLWSTVVILLVAGAMLYPLTAAPAKMHDRMSPSAPHTLDGMTYMQTSTYVSPWGMLNLTEDYDAIRWMQENVQGSPVIVEASVGTYSWGSRFSIYTGLPTVIGWNVHESQQRAILPLYQITDRESDVSNFYTTNDRDQALAFLRKYNVKYIVLGQLERDYYGSSGLAKFDQLTGDLWRPVFSEGETTIYEVLQ
jgi:YYY domain-containing protein